MNSETATKKEIIYRSVHRGCKETDHLIGEFVKAKIDDFSSDQLALIQGFILEDDLAIYEWIMNRGVFDDKYSDIITMIRDFHNITV